MLKHNSLGNDSVEQKRNVARLIKIGHIKFGGYIKGKIYGHLNCAAGKRMKVENRVFFASEEDAITAGYRPCGHCMRKAYQNWKEQQEES